MVPGIKTIYWIRKGKKPRYSTWSVEDWQTVLSAMGPQGMPLRIEDFDTKELYCRVGRKYVKYNTLTEFEKELYDIHHLSEI